MAVQICLASTSVTTKNLNRFMFSSERVQKPWIYTMRITQQPVYSVDRSRQPRIVFFVFSRGLAIMENPTPAGGVTGMI